MVAKIVWGFLNVVAMAFAIAVGIVIELNVIMMANGLPENMFYMVCICTCIVMTLLSGLVYNLVMLLFSRVILGKKRHYGHRYK